MNIEIANRLQKLRKEKGYSQEQLAEALGLSRQAVSKWERAEASPDTDNLICLARLYGISLDELLSTSDTIEDIKQAKEDKESEKKDRVNISFSGIDIEDKNGEKVHIGFDGIKEAHKNHHDELTGGKKTIMQAFSVFFTMGCVIAYLVMGFVWSLWHPGWIIFLFNVVAISVVSAILHKEFSKFAYPVLVTAIYLILGFKISGWHPYWFLFLTIPLYYVLFDPIDELINKKTITTTKDSIEIETDDEHISIKK